MDDKMHPLADGQAAPVFLPVVAGTARWNLQVKSLLHTLPDWPAGAIRAFYTSFNGVFNMNHLLLGQPALVRCEDGSVHIGRVQYLDSCMVALLEAVELPLVTKGVSLSMIADADDLEGHTTLPQRPVSVIADYTRIVSCTRQLLESAQAIEPLK